MKLSEMIATHKAEQEWLAKVLDAAKTPDFDIMAMDGFDADDVAGRLTEMNKRREDNDTLKASIDSLTALAETPAPEGVTEQTTTRSMPPARPKAYSHDNPIVDLSKALFDNEDFRQFAKNPEAFRSRPFSKSVNFGFKGVHDALMMAKAAIVSVGDIQSYGPIALGPLAMPTLLDVCAFQPVAGDVYRSRVQADSGPQPTALDGTRETSAAVTATNHTVETIMGTIPVANRMVDTDPSILATTAENLMRQVRKVLEAQVTNGNGTTPNLQGLLALLTGGTGTAAVTANTAILGGDEGVDSAIATLGNRGANANVIAARAGDLVKIYQSLRNKGFAVPDFMAPYGGSIGARGILASGITANNAIVGEFGDPAYHFVGLKADVVVEADTSREFDQDNTVLRAKIYAVNVVQHASAFFKFTATNNWDVES